MAVGWRSRAEQIEKNQTNSSGSDFFFWIFLQFWNRRGSISLTKNYGRWVALESRKNLKKLKN